MTDGDDMTAADILPETEITGLTADSRKVAPGFLFAAIPGTKADGRAFIGDAIARGARVILAPPGTVIDGGHADVTVIHDANPRRRLARMAAAFYQPQPETLVAVTGTNGKTSVANFTHQIWQAIGTRSAAIGTLGVRGEGFDSDHGLTTPDPVDLHRLMGEMRQAGISAVALEASSHGLDQYRLDGARFTAAAFTNLSRDHLDYHGTMEAYREAKLRLFGELLSRGGTAVVNTAAAEHDRIVAIAEERRQRVISYGLSNGHIRCAAMTPQRSGFALTVEVMGETFAIDFPLPGRFQVENALAALGLVIGSGTGPRHAVPQLSRLRGVRGRLERVASLGNGAAVYVDYAHTPDSLETVLKTLRPHTAGRLSVVFGCGGDRDPGKRPLMGKAVADHADIGYLTDDNPRSENPEQIRREARAGAPDAVEIGDRREAIAAAIAALGPGDVLCIAGKGHEQGQIVGDKTLPFDDAAVARGIVETLTGTVSPQA